MWRESERGRKEMANLLVLPSPVESLQNGNLEQTGPADWERVASAPQSKKSVRTPEPP